MFHERHKFANDGFWFEIFKERSSKDLKTGNFSCKHFNLFLCTTCMRLVHYCNTCLWILGNNERAYYTSISSSIFWDWSPGADSMEDLFGWSIFLWSICKGKESTNIIINKCNNQLDLCLRFCCVTGVLVGCFFRLNWNCLQNIHWQLDQKNFQIFWKRLKGVKEGILKGEC